MRCSALYSRSPPATGDADAVSVGDPVVGEVPGFSEGAGDSGAFAGVLVARGEDKTMAKAITMHRIERNFSSIFLQYILQQFSRCKVQ